MFGLLHVLQLYYTIPIIIVHIHKRKAYSYATLQDISLIVRKFRLDGLDYLASSWPYLDGITTVCINPKNRIQ